MNCPTQNDLVALLEDSLTPAEAAVLEEHLSGCPDCERSFAAIVSSENGDWETWKRLAHSEPTNVDRVQTTVSERAIAQQLVQSGFREIEVIGRGGMGIVFRGRQTGTERTVAIKTLLSGELAGPERFQRLMTEAQAIGQLDHPHIVKIFSVDSLPNDVPYLVLEYVEGSDLTRALADGPLLERKAATIALQIAQALGTAHEAGIIHRDVKPSNILFADGQSKLADFGLARLDERSVDLTNTKAIIGTTTYMSPEQAEGNQRVIGPESDVHATGVVLYEMLCGSVPFRGTSPIETLRLVSEREPVPPRQLLPDIPRDLETICLKCLQKDPRQRYADGSQLANDLSAYLDGRPISARPVSSLQKAWKWSKRQPVVAALTTAVITAVMCLLFVWVGFTRSLAKVNTELKSANSTLKTTVTELDVQKNIANEKASLAEQRLKLANENQEIADEINAFLQNDLLMQASAAAQYDWLASVGMSPNNFQRNPTVKQLLDRAAERLANDESLQAKPRLRAELLLTVGESYRSLGDFENAIMHFELAEELFANMPNAADSLCKCKQSLGASALALSRYTLAGQYLDQSHKIAAQTHGEESPQALLIDIDRAGLLSYNANEFLQSEVATFARDTLRSLEKYYEPSEAPIIRAQSILGRILLSDQQFDEALSLLKGTAEHCDSVLGKDHPTTLAAKFELARAYTENLQHQRGDALEAEVWQSAQRSLGEDHPTTLYYQLFALDGLTDEEAVVAAKDTMNKLSDVYPELHGVRIRAAFEVGSIYARAGQYDSAIETIISLRDQVENRWGENNRTAVAANVMLSRYLTKVGEGEKSIAMLESVLERQPNLPGYPRLFVNARRTLGLSYHAAGRTEEAIPVLKESFAEHRQVHGGATDPTVEAGLNLILVATKSKRFELAADVARQILEDTAEKLPPASPARLTTRQALGNALLHSANYAEAEKIIKETSAIYLKEFPESATGYYFLAQLASCQVFLEKHDDAEKNSLHAWDGLHAAYEKKPDALGRRRLQEVAGMLVQIYRSTDRDEQATEWKKKRMEYSSPRE